MSTLLHGIIGLIAGLNSAIWGSYKDCLYEEFKISKFLRSPILGFILGVLLFLFLSVNNVTANLGVFFAFVVVFERFTVEAYKLFIREEDQRKYFIPQQLHFLGNLINNKPARYLVGLFIVSLVLVSFYVPLIFPVNFQSILFVGLFWGAIGGLANSIGGALKDAPLEGFAPLKFWRSTVMAGLWGAIFSFFTSHPSLLLLASVGAERMTIEFYKTFIEGRAHSKLRAARDSKILFPDWDKKKIRFLILYLLTWVVFLIALL